MNRSLKKSMTNTANYLEYLKLFKNRNFTILWSGQTLLGFGDALFRVAQVALLMKLGGSAKELSALLLSAVLPSIILSLVGGTLADRMDRRKILIWGNVGRALLMSIFTVLIVTQHLELWHLYALAILQSCVSALANPSFDSLLPLVVSKEQLVSANAAFMLGDQMAYLIGPAVGGALLYLLGFAGMSAVNAGAACLMVLFLTLLTIQHTAPQEAASESFFKDLVGSFSYVRTNKTLLVLLSFFAIGNISAAILAVSLPLMVTQVLGQDVAMYGLFLTFMNVGIVVGAALMGVLDIKRQGIALAVATLLKGLFGYLLLAFSNNIVLSIVAVMLIDGLVMVGNIIYPAYVQKSVPDEYRGRVFGFTGMMSYSLVPLGYVVAGWSNSALGPQQSLVYAGMAIVALGLFGLATPALRALRSDDQAVTSET